MKIRSFFLIILALFTAPGFAATTMFLEIDGIPGEATAAAHPRTLQIVSFSMGVANVAAPTGATKPTFHDMSFVKGIDKSSPLLYLNSASGKRIKTATFFVRSSPQNFDFYVIKLFDVLVTGVETGSSGDLPIETLTLNFARIEFHYTPTNAQTGQPDTANLVKTGWDILNNVPIVP